MGMNEPLHIGNVKPSGKVAIKYGNAYIVQVTPTSYTYSRNPDAALIFDSLEEAQKACGDHSAKFKYVSAAGLLKRKVYKWTIKCTTSPWEGRYISKRTAHKIRLDTAQYAKKFPTKTAAEKYIAELRPRYKAEFVAEEATE